jgi:hypothetical protein
MDAAAAVVVAMVVSGYKRKRKWNEFQKLDGAGNVQQSSYRY